MVSKVMLPAWQFILVWDIGTTLLLKFIKNLIVCKNSEKTLGVISARNPICHFGYVVGPSFCYTGFTQLDVSLTLGARESLPDRFKSR